VNLGRVVKITATARSRKYDVNVCCNSANITTGVFLFSSRT
jgi:hypothetical protein